MLDLTDNRLDTETSEFIEAFGRLVSEGGLPLSIGRVLGLLVISEPGRLSADEMKLKLKLSAGSVNAATNLLTKFGYVKKVTIPGERKFYYEFEAKSWQNAIDVRLAQMKNGIELAEQGLKIRKNDSRLLGMRSLYHQIYDAVQDITIETTN
jgi:DNA-binding transcriptional regulator GbsR (MarR family)